MEGTLDSPANSVVAELNLGDLDDINAEGATAPDRRRPQVRTQG